ncbi:MAG: molybdopterin-binding protein [Lentihominibacter sp.]
MLKDHITKEEALRRIREAWKPEAGTEEIPLAEADGRVLARDYHAAYSIPVVRASGMDGIAVSFDTLQDGIPDTSGWTEGNEYVRADTGDDFPDEYDTVLPVEWITFPQKGHTGITIEPKEMPGPVRGGTDIFRGMNVKPSGSLIKEGTLLAPAGTRITPLDMGQLATGGHDRISVIKKPRVAFIATGTELVSPGSELKRGQNFEANSYMARAMLEKMGAEVTAVEAVIDDKGLLGDAVDRAVNENDIVLISGGSSKGAEDYNWKIIEQRGKQLFRWVKAAPGRPMSAAVIRGKLIINLAGPTLGAYHGIDWCVREALSIWYTGEPGNAAWGTPVKVTLGADLRPIPLSAIIKMKVEDYTAMPAGGPGAGGPGGPGGDQASRRPQEWEANAIYITKPGTVPPRKGDTIEVRMIRDIPVPQTAEEEPGAKAVGNRRRGYEPKRGIGGWDDQADFYNKMASMEKGFTLNQINCIDADKNDTVLDIGCGPGRVTVPMAGRARSVTAADASPKMLQHCRSNAEKAGADNVTTVLMDWEDEKSVSRLEKHDIVIASRSIAMGDIDKLCSLARKYVVLIMWSHGYPSIPMIINELFKGVDDEEMPKPPFTRDRRHGNNMLYNRIYDMGYEPNVRIVDDGFTKVFGSREEAYADLSVLKPIRAELLQERYDVFKANVDRFLSENDDGTVNFLAPTKSIVVWWKPQPE